MRESRLAVVLAYFVVLVCGACGEKPAESPAATPEPTAPAKPEEAKPEPKVGACFYGMISTYS